MKKMKTERLAIRLDPSLKKRLLSSAKAEGITYSEAIRRMIKNRIAQEVTNEKC